MNECLNMIGGTCLTQLEFALFIMCIVLVSWAAGFAIASTSLKSKEVETK